MGIGLVYYFVYGKRNAARVRAENEGLHLNLPSR
jgi:hypothetical protein